MNYKRFELSNGLRVVAVKKQGIPLVTFRLFVKCGSRCDNGKKGVAHLVEHMIFRHAEYDLKGNVYIKIEALGGKLEGNTTKEYSDYSLVILKENYIKGLKLFSKMLFNTAFTMENIEAERKIIAEEIVNSLSTAKILWSFFAKTLWKESPLSDPILGTIDSIADITLKDVSDFYTSYYTGSNSVLVVIGDIDYHELEGITDRVFFSISKGERLAGWPKASHTLNENQTLHIDKEAVQTHLIVGYPGVSMNHNDIYAFKLINKIVGSGLSSRLYQELKVKLHLVYSLSSVLAIYEDTGYFAIWANFNNEKTEAILSTIIKEMGLLLQEKITEEELNRAKIRYKRDLLSTYETAHALAGFIGTYLILTEKIITFDDIIRKINDVNSDDLFDLARIYFQEKKRFTVSIGNR